MSGKSTGRNRRAKTRPADVEIPQVFRDIVLNNPETAMAVVHDGTIIEANEAWAQLFGGQDPAQFRGMNGRLLAAPQCVPLGEERLQKRERGELLSNSLSWDIIRLDGQRTRVEVSAIPWPSDPKTVLCVARDITEQEHRFEQLRKSEQLYRTLADTLPAGVIFRDKCNRVIYVNKQATELTGYSRDEIDQGMLLDSVDEESRLMWNHALSSGTAIVGREMEYTRKDGSRGWISASCQPVRDARGVYHGMCITFVDITERKAAEEALRAKTTELEALVTSFPDLFFHLDASCTFLNYWAGRDADLYAPPEQFLGKHVDEVLPKPVASKVKRAVSKALSTRAMITIEYRLAIKGKTKVFQARISPCYEGVLAVARDVTEHREAELELKKAHADLEKAYELQREFLNNVTHDVRSPVTAIMGYVDILLERLAGPLNDEQQKMLEKILESSKALLRLVDGLLEMARTSRGALTLAATEIKPAKLVRDVVEAFLPEAKEKGITLSLTEFNPSQKGIYDAEKLRSIIGNLLSNAIKFTEVGGVEVTSTVTDAGLEVIVADTGIGIPEEGLTEIFGEFTQLNRSGQKRVGFGLGLSIVAKLVDTIDAGVMVSSVEGVGTAFTLYAPNLKKRRQ